MLRYDPARAILRQGCPERVPANYSRMEPESETIQTDEWAWWEQGKWHFHF